MQEALQPKHGSRGRKQCDSASQLREMEGMKSESFMLSCDASLRLKVWFREKKQPPDCGPSGHCLKKTSIYMQLVKTFTANRLCKIPLPYVLFYSVQIHVLSMQVRQQFSTEDKNYSIL